MPSLIDRVELVGQSKTADVRTLATKASYSSGIDNWLWGSIASRNHNLRNDQMGYAMAYLLVPDVRTCVDIYAWQIASILNEIVSNDTFDPANDVVIARSDDVRTRHVYYAATRRFRRVYKIRFLMRLAYMYVLFDEMYVLPQANQFGFNTDLAVLNTIAVEPEIQNGELVGYRYNGDGQYLIFKPHELAYDHGFNPLDDLRGSSILQTAIDNVNVLRNLVRYLTDFFANNARPGMTASFKDAAHATEDNTQKLKDAIQKFLKGLGDQFNTFISPVPLDWQVFENPDVKKQYALEEPIVRQIYRAFRVPMALAGDTQATTYKEAPAMLKTFVGLSLIPHLHNIEDFISDAVLPALPDTKNERFKYDLGAFKIVTEDEQSLSEISINEYQGQLSTLAESQEKAGLIVDEWGKDRIFIDGLPIKRSMIDEIIHQKYLVANSTTETSEDISIGMPGDESGDSTSLAEPIVNEEGVEIPQGQVFAYHIDAGIVGINEGRATLGLSPKKGEETNELQKLQAQLAVMVTAVQAGIPTRIAGQMVGLTVSEQLALPGLATPETETLPAPDNATSEDVQAEPEVQEPDKSHTVESEQTPAFAFIPLANNVDVLKIQRTLKDHLQDDGIKWQLPPTFHITLCYAGLMDDKAIEKMVSLIDLEALELQPVQGHGLDYFDTPDGKALHIPILRTSVLDAIQADVYSAFETGGHDLSEFSRPGNWNPHITLAYIPNEIELKVPEFLSENEWIDSIVIFSDSIVISRDDYDPVVVIKAPEYKSHSTLNHALENVKVWDYTREKALKELANWQRKLKAGKTFTPEYVRGDIGDLIQNAIDHDADITKTFDSAFDILKRGDSVESLSTKAEKAFFDLMEATTVENAKAIIKSLQSIRIDFELDFEDVLADIRNGNIDNRRRAGNILRQLIRTFGFRAYKQGLEDGGVMDDPNEEEQAEIATLRTANSQFVSNITQVLIREDGITDTQAAGKPEMWFRKTILKFYTAGFVSAKRNQMMEFTGRDGVDSCATCQRLKGQRHRAKDWNKKELWPQRDTAKYNCGGWKCSHILVPVSAKATGNF